MLEKTPTDEISKLEEQHNSLVQDILRLETSITNLKNRSHFLGKVIEKDEESDTEKHGKEYIDQIKDTLVVIDSKLANAKKQKEILLKKNSKVMLNIETHRQNLPQNNAIYLETRNLQKINYKIEYFQDKLNTFQERLNTLSTVEEIDRQINDIKIESLEIELDNIESSNNTTSISTIQKGFFSRIIDNMKNLYNKIRKPNSNSNFAENIPNHLEKPPVKNLTDLKRKRNYFRSKVPVSDTRSFVEMEIGSIRSTLAQLQLDKNSSLQTIETLKNTKQQKDSKSETDIDER